MLSREQIMEIIPHRPPMLLLDEVLEMEPGKACVGLKRVNAEDFYFNGHFPGNPIMPGVFILEALAQAGAVAILSLDEFKGQTGLFAGINGAKFKRKVIPGDILTLKVEIIKRRGPIGVGRAEAYVDNTRAAFGELTFAIEKTE